MRPLNDDLLLQILKELEYERKTLHSCLLVNRTLCVMAVPILWRNLKPNSLTANSYDMLFNMIISHLSEESRDVLKNLITFTTYQRLLFNYISFLKYFNFYLLERGISSKMIKGSNIAIIRNELLKLFINKDTKLTHISIDDYDYQLHLMPGAECCLSKLKSFNCVTDISQNILEGLARICKSIKKISLHVNVGHSVIYNNGIFKLIEIQNNLNDFSLVNCSGLKNVLFNKSLEASLIKHANTMQYLVISWNPTMRFLSRFVNLLSLQMRNYRYRGSENLENLNLSFPLLKVLQITGEYPFNIIINIIENTTGNLSEINIVYNGDNNKKLIQSIYQKCPNLRYLQLLLSNDSSSFISEFENLLVNCQSLKGLSISMNDDFNAFSWDKFFIILAESAPASLFKFKFRPNKSEDLELFFDNWKNRNPMLNN
ncbi:hypothetical protein GLOIN_2v813753 [Rhizophagus clarus]|uniref:F-box domain-containing protein n=1 Tax=Rhizophagus clarus TaxID=94130 RepID=A0A8H3R0Q5_9GLOM|nr:hypothetical protein GLOIN_2v813753 [Rhizophagus clarus]